MDGGRQIGEIRFKIMSIFRPNVCRSVGGIVVMAEFLVMGSMFCQLPQGLVQRMPSTISFVNIYYEIPFV